MKKTDIATNMQLTLADLQAQHNYVEKLKRGGDQSYSLVAADAFIRGMRDSGYKSTATAIDEFCDNSVQAMASRVDVITDLVPGKKEIAAIAIIDDGHGMEPDMIRASVLWGGTHRENDRSGYGRYGFGLPSAAVSIAKHFDVYSKTKGGSWHRVSIDLIAIAQGKHTNHAGLVVAPDPIEAPLPAFVTKYLGDRDLEHGTIVVLNHPDRLTSGYRKADSFADAMLKHLGLIYRGVIRDCAFYVNGQKVDPIDPLFLDPNARYFDVGNGRFAEALEPIQFEMKSISGDVTGSVRLRFSYMAPNFQNDSKERLSVMKANNAYLIVMRAGRQIDLVTRLGYNKEADNITLVNYDRNWAIELDFDPVLDEDFGVTVNKQQISLQENVWQVLTNQGLPTIVKALRARVKRDKEALEGELQAEAGKDTVRESEAVMQDATKFSQRRKKLSVEKEEQATEKVLVDAEHKAKASGRDVTEVVKEIIEDVAKRPFKIEFEHLPGAPFFRPEQYGGQKRLYINSAHRFYSDVYNGPGTNGRLQAAIELLLFVLGASEVDATGDLELFYQSERGEWSKQLNLVLNILDNKDPIIDAKSAATEDAETNGDAISEQADE